MNVTSNLLCVPMETHRRQDVPVQNNLCKTNSRCWSVNSYRTFIVPVYSSRLTKNADAYFWKLQSLDFSVCGGFRFIKDNHINFTVAATTGSISKSFYLLFIRTFFLLVRSWYCWTSLLFIAFFLSHAKHCRSDRKDTTTMSYNCSKSPTRKKNHIIKS